MATETLSTIGDEGSGYVVSVDEFLDQESSAITPKTITWTLTDLNGNIINSRSEVEVTPDTSVEIGLLAADTTAYSGDDVSTGYFYRLMLIEYTYDATINGDTVEDYPGKKELKIKINSFVNV